LDLSFDILNRIRWLNFEGNRLTRKGFDKDLHLVWMKLEHLKIVD